MHKALPTRDDVDRLYFKKRARKRTCQHWRQRWRIDTTTQDYIQKHNGGLITAIRNDTDNTIDNRMMITRKQKWEGKRLINNTWHDKTWTRLRKGNFKIETESLLMAAQNSAIRTKHIKARVDRTQQNSKCRLYGDRDETINHIISKCSKLAQKDYKARHDWLGKVIHWEMCKKFQFDRANKWCMHNPAPVQENDTQTPIGFWHTNGSLNLGQKTKPYNCQQKKRKSAKLSTLLSRLTTEYNWKNAKREISTWTLLENWKNYGTWRWRLYQLWLVLLAR